MVSGGGGRQHQRVPRRLGPPLLRLLLTAVLAAGAGAQAAPCRIDPFGAESIVERTRTLMRGCTGVRVDYGLRTARAQPTDSGPSRVDAHLDATTTRGWGQVLLGTLRLSWAGSGSEQVDRFGTDRVAWAAGAWLQPHPSWAVQMNIGREDTGIARTRAVFAGIWRPLHTAAVFAEWAGDGQVSAGQRLGLRWWLVPNRLVLEAGGQRAAALGWTDRRVSLHWGLLR